jgi:hypothetical protein
MAEERVVANACLLLVISAHAAAVHARYTVIDTTRARRMAPEKKKIRKKKDFHFCPPATVYARRVVDLSALAFSLPSHRHSYVSLLFSSRFIVS